MAIIIAKLKKQYLGDEALSLNKKTLEILHPTTGINKKTLRQMFNGSYEDDPQDKTLDKLCLALDCDSFAEFVEKNKDKFDLKIKREVSDSLIKEWMKDNPLSQKSMKFNEDNYGISQPLIIPLKYASDENYWKNWAFCSALIQDPIKIQKINSKFQLNINLQEEQLAIYNNAGKKFIEQIYSSSDKDDADKRRSKNLEEFLSGKLEKNEFLINSTPLRFSSGGVLPIVSFRPPGHQKKSNWVLLFWRDLDPKAWTIPLGGSHDESELKNLTKLIYREFSEEVLLLDRHPKEGRVFQKKFFHPERSDNNYISLKYSETQRRLRLEHDDITIALSDVGGEVEIRTDYSDMDISVNSELTRSVHLSINPKEFGIEAVKIVHFNMEDEDYILDGEISEHDEPFLIRRSPMLLRLEAIKSQLDDEGKIGSQTQSKDPHLADCRELNGLTEKDFYLFDYEIELRKRRFEFLKLNALPNPKELSFHENWLKSHETKFNHESISDSIILAPVVWKILHSLLISNHS